VNSITPKGAPRRAFMKILGVLIIVLAVLIAVRN
jgi:hypothetical protein